MRYITKIIFFAVILNLSVLAYADIIINEAMINPAASSDTQGEWLELYNDSDTAIDINSWVIKDNDSNLHQINNTIPLIIGARGFLVLGRNEDFALNGGYTPDYVYSSFVLSNSNDEIILENNGAEISRIDYTNIWPIESGSSLMFNGSGAVNNQNNWSATPQTSQYIFGIGDYGTPGGANVIPEPSSLILWGIGLLAITLKRKK